MLEMSGLDGPNVRCLVAVAICRQSVERLLLPSHSAGSNPRLTGRKSRTIPRQHQAPAYKILTHSKKGAIAFFLKSSS